MSAVGKTILLSLLHGSAHIGVVGLASALTIVSIVTLSTKIEITESLVFVLATAYCAFSIIFLTKYISKNEFLHRSIFLEHLRQMWLVYPILIYFLFSVVHMWNNPNYTGEPGKVFAFVVTYILSLCVALNLIVLFYKKYAFKNKGT